MRILNLLRTGLLPGRRTLYIYDDGDHEVLDDPPEAFYGGVEIPEEPDTYYLKTDLGAFVIKVLAAVPGGNGGGVIVHPYDTWASETGSWLDGTFRMNGALSIPEGSFTISERIYEVVGGSSSRLGPFSSPLDFGGNYFFLPSDAVETSKRPLKIKKDFSSHEYIDVNVGPYHLVSNRDIMGSLGVRADQDSLYFLYVNAETNSYTRSNLPDPHPTPPSLA